MGKQKPPKPFKFKNKICKEKCDKKKAMHCYLNHADALCVPYRQAAGLMAAPNEPVEKDDQD